MPQLLFSLNLSNVNRQSLHTSLCNMTNILFVCDYYIIVIWFVTCKQSVNNKNNTLVNGFG